MKRDSLLLTSVLNELPQCLRSEGKSEMEAIARKLDVSERRDRSIRNS